jgi:ribosomal protein S18 acetylase RimI-like enzyme
MIDTQILVIREATQNDLPTVHTVTQAAYEQIRSIIGSHAHVFQETTDSLLGRMADGWIMLLAEVDGQAVGVVRLLQHEGELYIGRLAVLPEAQHAGVGRALVATAEECGRQRGLPVARLGAYEDVTASRPYYERLGYHADERVELRSSPGRYFWVMRKSLD